MTYYIDPDAFYIASPEDQLQMANEALRRLNKERQWLTQRSHELPSMGIVHELGELFPDSVSEWVTRFPFVYIEVMEITKRCPANRPGWSDYHMARWSMSHNVKHVPALLSRLVFPDEQVMSSTLWMMRSQCVKFPELLDQVRAVMFAEPPEPELVGVIWILREGWESAFGQKILREVREAQAYNELMKRAMRN